MSPDGIGARLLDVGGKHAGSVLKLEFRACRFDAKHARARDDCDDRKRDDHLRDGEPALLRLCFAVGFHLRDYLRQANPRPSLASAVPGGLPRFFEGSRAMGQPGHDAALL